MQVMSRTDDVINVAGHRLCTGSIEEVIQKIPEVVECAVVSVRALLFALPHLTAYLSLVWSYGLAQGPHSSGSGRAGQLCESPRRRGESACDLQ